MKFIKKIFMADSDTEAKSAIMGVCSYTANRFSLDVLAVRIVTVLLVYNYSDTMFLLYIVFGVVLSISGEKPRKKKAKKKSKVRVSSEASRASEELVSEQEANQEDELKSNTPLLSRVAVKQLERRLQRIDRRMQGLEGCIISSHFKMSREFKNLEKESVVQ